MNRKHECQFDLLIIGCGIAGLSHAIQAARLYPQAKIALLCKTAMQESNSSCAQGGIAASVENQTIPQHITDTLNAGAGLSEPQNVEKIIQQSQSAIEFLTACGVSFDRNTDESFNLGR